MATALAYFGATGRAARTRRLIFSLICTGLAWAAAGNAQAAQTQSISPVGEVHEPSQVVVQFAQDVVPLGQPTAPAPVQVRCEGSPTPISGQGRWISGRRWVWDFALPLAAGLRCTVTPEGAFRDLAGQPLHMPEPHHFHTGGPLVTSIMPSGETMQANISWSEVRENSEWLPSIDENQVFIVAFSAAVDPASVQAKTYCEVADVGERIPVRLLPQPELNALLESEYGMTNTSNLNYLGLSCQRLLSQGAPVRLVFDKGLQSASGLPTQQAQTWFYQVRAPFTATLTCQREQANKACIPVLPLELNFSAAMDMRWLQHIQLRAADGRTWQGKANQGDMDEDYVSVEQWKEKPLPGRYFDTVRFEPPFAPNAELELVLPPDLEDESGRKLSNAASFPLKVRTQDMPALAKFATGEFAVIERFAEGYHEPALLPVTLRAVEAPLPVKVLKLHSDADILEWMWRVERLRFGADLSLIRQLGLSAPSLPKLQGQNDPFVEGRTISLLNGAAGVQEKTLPVSANNPNRRETEVVGIPLEPGFQVVEIASPILGRELLDPTLPEKERVLYTRTAVLVTNLMVHFKLGVENSMAWVTALDSGKPVAGARVQVNCDRHVVAQGVTDSQGMVRFDKLDPDPECKSANELRHSRAYLVSARTDDGDLGLVSTDWMQGIEPWRFDVPYNYQLEPAPTLLHTVLDRSLLRAGDTVSMKHYARQATLAGLADPQPSDLPQEVLVRHEGSGREYKLPLQWQRDSGGSFSATSTLALPQMAALGSYAVQIHPRQTAQFRVEEFRLPVFTGSIVPAEPAAQTGTNTLDMLMHLGYVSGGNAADWPVQISALIQPRWLHFPQHQRYRFDAPRSTAQPTDENGSPTHTRLLLDKAPLKLDAQGNGKFRLEQLDQGGSDHPRDIRIEATFEDPNGEMQTITRIETVWPTSALIGIDTDHWISVKKPLPVRTLVVAPDGKPVAGAPVEIRARAHTTLTTRKRMVGGFYKYEHHGETRDLGVLCQGHSDSAGRFTCTPRLDSEGEVELVAQVRDSAGRSFTSAMNIWVAREGQLWFDAESSDRMDVLPEKTSYQPGETARFQVRMPYRKAQALIAVEREGVLQAQVMELSGDDPSFTLPIDQAWGPNVYVSVLAVRGRLRDVPWYSFFTWGWRSPLVWWNAWRSDTGEALPPTAMVDLSKPSYRLGVANVRVGDANHRMQVRVQADKERYATRERATLTIEAKLPDGRPAAGAQVALAVVDQALLELAPNPSWNLLDAMMQPRSWGVRTTTAQMEVVGRRHYGLKARAAGGGGGDAGQGATRELFDTLLLWQPNITLDANGRAQVPVPLNDSVTRFHAEAIATAGAQFFGSGSGQITVAQDLQLISGLPPVVRSGDEYDARISVRNTTASAWSAELTGSYGQQSLEPRRIEVPAGGTQTVQWRVTAPALPNDHQAEGSTSWHIQAQASGHPQAKDALRIEQKLLSPIPVTVRQASLHQLSDGPLTLEAAMPQNALEGRGGLSIDAQASLAGDVLPGLRLWWENYPYACLEQRHSKALGMMDADLLKQVLADLPSYLDSDGLASYFPVSGGYTGDIALTAHLLSADATLGQLGRTDLRIPEDTRTRMLQALANVAEGRLERRSYRFDRTVEQLTVIAALAQHGQASASMMEKLSPTATRLPTHALLDWLLILKHAKGLPNQPAQLQQVQQALRARLVQTGVQTLFSTEDSDNWWWVMQNGNTNAARLLLITADLPGWKMDAAGLVSGLIARQQNGHWGTTTANLWAHLALQRFAQLHESQPVAGTLYARFGGQEAERTWPTQPTQPASTEAGAALANTSREKLHIPFAWPDAIARLGDASGSAQLRIEQQGSGAPWVTISALAAVPLTQSVASGLRVEKTIEPVVQARPGQWSQGDVYRVRLTIHSQADVGMTALSDPIPSGSTILGSGLGRDSQLAQGTPDESSDSRPAWAERKMDLMRVYYWGLPKGETHYSYTVRLNQPGQFQLPPTRAEALYMPQVFGETPNAPITIGDLPR